MIRAVNRLGSACASLRSMFAPAEIPTPTTGLPTQLGDYGSDVPGVILDMVGARQRIGRARAARIDRDDPELLAELFEDGLDRAQPIGQRADQEQRDLAARHARRTRSWRLRGMQRTADGASVRS